MASAHFVIDDGVVMVPPAMGLLKKAGRVIQLREESEKALVKAAKGALVIISNKTPVTARVIESGKDTLRGVVSYGVGYDQIDVVIATSRGIYIANCRGSNSESVAELTFTFMLNLSRAAPLADRYIREGKWKNTMKRPGIPVGSELAGKTLGILGMGAIGKRVARIGRSFEMRIIAFDPFLSNKTIRQAGADPVAFAKLLRESDYLSIHVPLSETTRNLIDARSISLMKTTSYLINTARGPIVNEKALLNALITKKIAGAGLDVFSVEPLPMRSKLSRLRNVVMTPHIGALTKEAIAQTSMTAAEESVRIATGEVPINLVNRKELVAMGFRA